MPVIVDTNVILDLVTDDQEWADWSESQINQLSKEGLWTNGIIFSELCVGAESVEEVEELLLDLNLEMHELGRGALFAAAKAFKLYRSRSGEKTSPLPDFYIGAQAEVLQLPLLTRDPRRFRTYFPTVKLICPE